MAWYLRALRYCVEHRRRTFAGFAVFFFASVAGLFFILKNAFPSEDSGTSQITVELVLGVRIDETGRVTKRAAEIVASHDEVSDVLEMVGGGDDNDVRNGQLFVALKPRAQRKLDQKTWQDQVQMELGQYSRCARVVFQSARLDRPCR
jgi:multidrug efflux pump subunit AcrB